MASLEDNLNQLLSDPNAMEQIFSLAGKLGMSSEPSGEPEAEEQPLSEREPEAAELSQPLFGAEGLGGLGKLLEIFQGSQQTAQEADALLDALRPFLRQERQEKLDRARRLAGLSRAADRLTDSGRRESCMYNAYIPGGEPMKQSRRITILRDFTAYLKKKAVPFPGC